MNWKPDKRQLDLIADMGNARMRANSIALALCITEAEFSAWTERLVAARSMDAYALMYPAPSPAAPWGIPTCDGADYRRTRVRGARRCAEEV